jgi:hypothetical protein
VIEEETYQAKLARNRFSQAALSVSIDGHLLQQPYLTDLAWHLYDMDEKRKHEKGKPMSDDHLKQEAVKWAKSR